MRSGSVRSRGHVRVDPVLYPALARLVARPGRRGEVLAGMWAGKGMKEIAADLGISAKTVESYRAHIKLKLDLKNAHELTQHAVHWVETHHLN